MGAGEDDDAYLRAARLVEQRQRRCAHLLHRHRLAGELALGQLDQLARSVADDGAAGGEPLGEVVDVALADGRLGAEHADGAAAAPLRRWLDRRDGSDHRHVERGPGVVERDGAGGVAGDHHQPRPEALDQAGEKRRDPRGDLGLRLVP